MKRWMTAIAILLFGASLSVALAQQQGGPPPDGPRGPRGPRGSFVDTIGKQLDLTDAQKDQIRSIEQGTRDENHDFFETARKTMEEFRAARQANDTAKLEALKPTLDAQRQKMREIMEGQMKKIVATLTSDQQAKLEKLRQEHQSQRQQQRPS